MEIVFMQYLSGEKMKGLGQSNKWVDAAILKLGHSSSCAFLGREAGRSMFVVGMLVCLQLNSTKLASSESVWLHIAYIRMSFVMTSLFNAVAWHQTVIREWEEHPPYQQWQKCEVKFACMDQEWNHSILTMTDYLTENFLCNVLFLTLEGLSSILLLHLSFIQCNVKNEIRLSAMIVNLLGSAQLLVGCFPSSLGERALPRHRTVKGSEMTFCYDT